MPQFSSRSLIDLHQLSTSERNFLARHKIRTSEVFDAGRMKKEDYYREMKKEQLLFAISDTFCNFGHRLRDRNGHCIQCNTACIAYIRRYFSPGHLYIAASPMCELIKVGVTIDLQSRDMHLNRDAYAGGTDWRFVCSVFCHEAGRVEMQIHTALRRFQVRREYKKAGAIILAREIFACSVPRAWKLMSQMVPADRWQSRQQRKDAFINYNFDDDLDDLNMPDIATKQSSGSRPRSGRKIRSNTLTREHLENGYREL